MSTAAIGNTSTVPRSATFPRAAVILLALFVLTLPFANPWVRGDGVGYYAYVRAAVVRHNLRFEPDWERANPSARATIFATDGTPKPYVYTSTGHLVNHFAVGPAVLWAPFYLATHLAVLGADRLGAHVPADGYSRPYLMTMALATALYGFAGLLLAFDLARRYVDERCAFLATLGIWFASSLPVYMYFNPSWSHAHSAFAVALFVWYWDRTRGSRTWAQWAVLGAISGLMMDVYYPNALLLLLPLLESLAGYGRALKLRQASVAARLLGQNLMFSAVILAAFLPTLITRKIIYGGFLDFGYGEKWFWNSPSFFQVCFSARHGLFTWTPVAIPAVLGLLFLYRHDRRLSVYSIIAFLGYVYFIGCYQNWHGISSFGSRFLVSLTPLFVLGLAATLDFCLRRFGNPARTLAAAGGVLAILMLWNFGFIFQWGTQLISARDAVSWSVVAHNQYAVVPERITDGLENYFLHRKGMMQHIESQDVQRLKLPQ